MGARRLVLVALFVIILSAALLRAPIPTSAAPTSPAIDRTDADQADTCRSILTRALQTLNDKCDNVTRNSACYGNDSVKAELNSSNVRFNVTGDRAPIQAIKSIQTFPLDPEHGTWGLSLLKLQANLPDTMPGQNVTFLVYGDTSVQNASGNMQAFYFSSGLGTLSCKEAPPDGILVRSPNHTEVTFTANGVQVTIASTIYLHAVPRKSMEVELIEGHARVTTAAGSQTLQPGEVVSVPMGGASGLQPIGAPSVPVAAPANSGLMSVVDGSTQFASADAPVNVSVDGCISKIEGNIATIYDYHVLIDPKNPALKNAKVGDCVQVNATVQAGSDGNILLIPVVVRPVARPVASDGSKPGTEDNAGSQGGAGDHASPGNSNDHGDAGNSGDHGSVDDHGGTQPSQGNPTDSSNGGMGDMGSMGGMGN